MVSPNRWSQVTASSATAWGCPANRGYKRTAWIRIRNVFRFGSGRQLVRGPIDDEMKRDAVVLDLARCHQFRRHRGDQVGTRQR